jgi:altronate hydrolase
MSIRQPSPLLVIHPRDNVAVALENLAGGRPIHVGGRSLGLVEDIPCGHKCALVPLAAGQPVIRYGQPIGSASCPIQAGGWVHVHNLRTNLAGVQQYAYHPTVEPVATVDDGLTFDGFVRPNGEVGVRNEIWVLPTVGCVNAVAQKLVQQLRERGLPENVEGVYAFPHPHGCSQLGDDHLNTQRILAGLAQHPNAGGVLMVGLGCENNTMASFRKLLGDQPAERFQFLVVQDSRDELADGMRCLGNLAEYAGRFRREALPVSRLRIGLKCGGSDGFSGITANPLLGAFSDELVRRGGTTVLTEVPEMFGAEVLFMNRCASRDVFDACVRMVNDFKEFFLRHSQPVYENPSPGNKQGGITTLEEKSLGCLQKGGTTPVQDVLPYGGRVCRAGLNFLAGPGNDPVSLTALVAAGSHLVLFTTGLGNPLGGPVPTVKVASNSSLAERKPHWIDYDAGRLLQGAALPDVTAELWRVVLAIASGRKLARNETNGYRDIAILKEGVTL